MAMMMMQQQQQQQRNNVGVINNSFRKTHPHNGRHKFFKIWDTVFEVEAKYVPKDAIGRGAYGVVCSSIDTLTNQEVAIKKINVLENSDEALKALRELKILRHVRHNNVIALKDVMVPSVKCEDVYLVFELMDCDLGILIRPSLRLPNDLVQYLMFQLLNGVKYLHASNIIHRDLKPGNVLLKNNYELKICDFGLATTTKGLPQYQAATEYVVTRWYRAPELLLGCDTYGPSIDVWSVGCILAELLGGNPLFPGNNRVDQLMKIIRILGTQNVYNNLGFLTSWEALNLVKSLPYTPGIAFESLFPYADREGLDLLNKMLQFDPRKRITAAEALQHPYLRSTRMYYYSLSSQPTPYPCSVDVDAKVGVEKIRKIIWDEMLLFHIQAAAFR